MFQHILVPVDLSDRTRCARGRAAELAQGGRVTLLHVIETLRGVEYDELEDFYSSWHGTDFELELGRDFDVVVYALPVGTIPWYCAQLVEEQPTWQQMVEHVRGVDTSSLWLYFEPDLEGLGWNYPSPVLTSYARPLSTWEETTYLVDCETWPPGRARSGSREHAGRFCPCPVDRRDHAGDGPRRDQGRRRRRLA